MTWSRQNFYAEGSIYEATQEQTRQGVQIPRKEANVRRAAIRSVRGYIQQDSVIPWRGYVLWIGSALLLLLLAVDGVMPRTASRGTSSTEVEFPPIRIHSDVRVPKAVVIDTGQATLPAVSDHEPAAAERVISQNSGSVTPFDQSVAQPTVQQVAANSAPLASAPSPVLREAFAQLARPERSVSRKPKSARPASPTRRNAQARSEAPRQHAERVRYFACERCGPFKPGDAF